MLIDRLYAPTYMRDLVASAFTVLKLALCRLHDLDLGNLACILAKMH